MQPSRKNTIRKKKNAIRKPYGHYTESIFQHSFCSPRKKKTKSTRKVNLKILETEEKTIGNWENVKPTNKQLAKIDSFLELDAVVACIVKCIFCRSFIIQTWIVQFCHTETIRKLTITVIIPSGWKLADHILSRPTISGSAYLYAEQPSNKMPIRKKKKKRYTPLYSTYTEIFF